jgi:hypothetical protein
MLQRTQATFPGFHLPLRKLALCLDCDECFSLGAQLCPACGSGTWTPAARFLDLMTASRTHRAAGGVRRLPTRRAAEELAIAKHLLIVARHRRELYQEIERAFAGHESVQVVLDRRVTERRQSKESPTVDRRRRNRRSRSGIDEQLRTIGWSLVLLDLTKGRHG